MSNMNQPKSIVEYKAMSIALIETYPIPGKAPIEVVKAIYQGGETAEVRKDQYMNKEDAANLDRCQKLLKSMIMLRELRGLMDNGCRDEE